MSVTKEVPSSQRLEGGLHIKRKCGEKIIIHHWGETLELQVSDFFSGFQTIIVLKGPESFEILRGELIDDDLG